MPIIHKNFLEVEAAFGFGDIEIGISTDKKAIGLQGCEPREIGEEKWSNDVFYPIVLSFTNKRSVDVLIKKLQELEF